MSEESCRSVPDEHLNAVWANRQTQTAALNYAKAPVEGNAPLGALVETGLNTARQLVAEVVRADYGFAVSFDTVVEAGKFAMKDVVKHYEGVFDNIEVSTTIESYYAEWWQDEMISNLVVTALFVSRVLRSQCQLRYPMVGKTMWGKYCEVEIVLPSGRGAIGNRIFLRK
ncbi:MAG: hypothetical protein HZB70_00420 [Candidatus Berkelbacteria bacterium]|nr:MAG: hypothetical protein HZB70_00420 [Candidatus Berkelbacteria bacterium]QQG51429.1 MAG: hypothetical protein HY845_02580 [Candidatus Berkelbacteria bacterium]